MTLRRSIRHRRVRKKIHGSFDLQLTSMMDILVIILVFLLKSYSASTNSFSTVPGLKLPVSRSEETPPDSLLLIATPEAIIFEGVRVIEFKGYQFNPEDLDENAMRIPRLFDALTKARDRAQSLRTKSKARDQKGNPLPFDGVLAIQADRRVHYDTLRKIMYTAGAAQFRTFRLLAARQEP